jgi:hypothetical protein
MISEEPLVEEIVEEKDCMTVMSPSDAVNSL